MSGVPGTGGEALRVHASRLPNGYEISDERARLDMDSVHRALETTYWASGRTRAVTARSWSNCLCVGVYGPEGGQVGFARVLTDYALRAHIGDVFVEPALRRLGLGGALVAFILAHPELGTVGKWTLTTADAQGLYARHGFRIAEADPAWMVLDRPGA